MSTNQQMQQGEYLRRTFLKTGCAAVAGLVPKS